MSTNSQQSTAYEGALPTYGDLIDLFEKFGSDQHHLCNEISKLFPSISVRRPGRVFDSISRIVAPTKPALNGTIKMTGSPLRVYRQRIWEPRVRSASAAKPLPNESYPSILTSYGFTEELLLESMRELEAGKRITTSWQCTSSSGKVPTIGFYRSMHHYLKQNTKATKTTIGKLYCHIDSNLKEKGSRPDNIYRFIETIVSSQRLSEEVMSYYHSQQQMHVNLRKCSEQLENFVSECSELRSQYHKTNSQLRSTKTALRNITNTNSHLTQKLKLATEKIRQLKCVNSVLKDECVTLQADLLSETEDDLPDGDSSDESFEIHETCDDSIAELGLKEIIGTSQKYTPEIRKLYYNLLAEQVPVSKVTDIIRHVLRCFNPNQNIDDLQLPKKSCAAYMRKEELKTICDAHKASVICELSSQSKQLHLNTDGTTKNQKKLGGVVANSMVLSVNELLDGSAASAIDDISREFEKLRHAATMLGLPNPNSINWTLVVSSSSDSAATQKRINKLIEDCRQKDDERFGSATVETIDVIESFCAMHLGVNLRKAFLNGIDYDSDRRYYRVDTFVHEFCKLFGQSGVPEYCSGVTSFPDFLEIKIQSTSGGEKTYYCNCLKTQLHRQVGSRYFVSAANACKIIFLRNAAIEYLKFTGKDAGNKLERDVLHKLQDPVELSHLKADSLMYYHIYGDLYMLSKSKELNLSAYSMNEHYLELVIYLSEVMKDPDIVFNQTYLVFPSEKRLYETNSSEVNIRLKSPFVYNALFEDVKLVNSDFRALIVKGATAMKEKLTTYARDQLPGGKYWNPDKEVKDILCQLQPSNDVCESVLGLNDYLTTALPNLHQMTRSNLVQLKKNKTMTWLSQLSKEKQGKIIELAMKQRHQVKQTCDSEHTHMVNQRKQAMIRDHAKREAIKKRLHQQKQKLSKLHLISTPYELQEELVKIDLLKDTNATKKRSLKLKILRTQVQIRKKVLGQVVPVTFTSGYKQRSIAIITQELSDFIAKVGIPAEFAPFVRQPISLVGKRIKHRFQNEGDDPESYTWYVGTVLDYNSSDKSYDIKYDGEDDMCCFDVTIDFFNGDLVIM